MSVQDKINAAFADGDPIDIGPDEPSDEIVDCRGGTILARDGRLWYCPPWAPVGGVEE